jgi:ABC-type polysaccharide/polyol phosphate export permease
MFATSVAYPLRDVEGRLGTVLRLNPMTAILDAYRDVLFGPGRPQVLAFSLAAVGAVVFLAVAWVMFHRSESEFAERI